MEGWFLTSWGSILGNRCPIMLQKRMILMPQPQLQQPPPGPQGGRLLTSWIRYMLMVKTHLETGTTHLLQNLVPWMDTLIMKWVPAPHFFLCPRRVAKMLLKTGFAGRVWTPSTGVEMQASQHSAPAPTSSAPSSARSATNMQKVRVFRD